MAAYFHRYASPLGGIILESGGDALTALRFAGEGTLPEGEERDLPAFAEAERWLDLYFSGRDPGFTPKTALSGTPFQRAVWEALRTIPYGETVTYAGLAERLGLPRASARAVGGACGRNPILLIIPCHRVVGQDGRPAGYAGGPERKRMLLETERENMSQSLCCKTEDLPE